MFALRCIGVALVAIVCGVAAGKITYSRRAYVERACPWQSGPDTWSSYDASQIYAASCDCEKINQ